MSEQKQTIVEAFHLKPWQFNHYKKIIEEALGAACYRWNSDGVRDAKEVLAWVQSWDAQPAPATTSTQEVSDEQK